MRIESRSNCVTIAAFLLSAAGIYVALQAAIKPKFHQIELATVKLDHKRAAEALEMHAKKLRHSVEDYGFWNTTHGFVLKKDMPGYLTDNIEPASETFESLDINVMIIRDKAGRVLWSYGHEKETKKQLKDFAKEISAFKLSHPSDNGGEVAKSVSGFMQTSKGLMLLAHAPILKSDRTGPVAGMMTMGTLVEIDALKETTGVELALLAISDPSLKIEEGQSYAHLENTVEVSELIRDFNGTPLAILKTATPRDVTNAGNDAINSATLLLVAVAAIVVLFGWSSMRVFVIWRLTALEEHFKRAAETGRVQPTHLTKTQDEISALARAFNGMAEQVNFLRDAVADSAYLSGMSEWASGTLHNVRNSLMPVSVLTWKMQNSTNDQWLQNVIKASEEMNSGDLTEERRQKVAQFISESAQKMASLVEQNKEYAREIEDANKAVIDIVSGFERYSHHETKHETAELAPMLAKLADMAVSRNTYAIKLDLPSGDAKVTGNMTVIRQIITNLLVNAIEAIGPDRMDGEIKIAIDPGPPGSSHVWISIIDNGEGIAAEKLPDLFKRGVSTRRYKKGGLGLHWCATAAKTAGGSITADSKGLGQGATFTLALPVSNQATEKAA